LGFLVRDDTWWWGYSGCFKDKVGFLGKFCPEDYLFSIFSKFNRLDLPCRGKDLSVRGVFVYLF